MVTRDVDLVVATNAVEPTVQLLTQEGFLAERHQWSVNLKGRSHISIQLSTEDFFKDFPGRSVPADVHGVLLRVASLEDTFRGKIKAWGTPEQRQSKRLKDLADIARLVESHPQLWDLLPVELRSQVQHP
jgi:hypothetical protein